MSMGMRKHGKSGFKNGMGKSPNMRHAERRTGKYLYRMKIESSFGSGGSGSGFLF